MFVNQKRKFDTCLITECARVALITQAHRSQTCSGIFEGIFLLAQLRDMLAAEDSTIMAEEHQDYGRIPPQRTKLYLPVVNIRQNDSREPAAVCGIHGHTILWHFSDTVYLRETFTSPIITAPIIA